MKVKICGIKTYEEALAAVEAGADLLGFNFYAPSPRSITPGACLRLQVKLQAALQGYPQHVRMVGVFVNASPEEVRRIAGDCSLDMVQLSGDETPQMVSACGESAFKALRLSLGQDQAALAGELAAQRAAELAVALASTYPRRGSAPAWLVDSYRPGAYGGTGQTADWSLARQLADRAPILLAGGLTASNVAEAIRQVRPWGVDVASGVESQPGVKDARLVAEFIRAARSMQPDAAEERR